MNRQEIIDKLQELQNKVNSEGFMGQNEYDLRLSHEIAYWIEKEFMPKADWWLAGKDTASTEKFTWKPFNSPNSINDKPE